MEANMADKLGLKIALSALSIATVLFSSTTSFAADHTGSVTVYHLNGTIQNRGSCIRMNPPLPGTGWACVWSNSNTLSGEINDLFREAYFRGRQCSVSWTS